MNIESYGESHMKKNNNIAIITVLITFICLFSLQIFNSNDKAPVTPTSSPVLITSSPIQKEEKRGERKQTFTKNYSFFPQKSAFCIVKLCN